MRVWNIIGVGIICCTAEACAGSDDQGSASGAPDSCGVPVTAGPAQIQMNSCRVTLSGEASTGFDPPVSFDILSYENAGQHPSFLSVSSAAGTTTIAAEYYGGATRPGTPNPDVSFAWTWRGWSHLCTGPLDVNGMSVFFENGVNTWACGHLLSGSLQMKVPYPPFEFAVSSGSGVGANPIYYSVHGSGKGVCAVSDAGYPGEPVTVQIEC